MQTFKVTFAAAMLLGVALAGAVVTRFEWMAVGVVLAGVVLLVRARS